MSQIQVRDVNGNPIKLLNIRVSLGDKSSDLAYDDKFTDFNGNLAFPVSLPSNWGYTLHCNYENVNEDFESYSLRVDTLDGADTLITLKRKVRPRAVISGMYSNVFYKGESAFLDLARLCHGQDIRPMLDQSLNLGSNGRRVFLMTFNTAQAAGLPPFNPDDFGNYYEMLELLLKAYAEYGLYLYGSVFPDNQLFASWKGNTRKQLDHWAMIASIAQKYTNVWGIELTNEPHGHTFNQVDSSRFSRIPGVISCIGSEGDNGGVPLTNQWDVVDFHFPRNYPKSVKDGCQADNPDRLQLGRAILGGEPLGFGEATNRERNPRIAKEIAGSSRGTCCGIVFHSQSGGFSQTYNQTEMECAKAWYKELQGT